MEVARIPRSADISLHATFHKAPDNTEYGCFPAPPDADQGSAWRRRIGTAVPGTDHPDRGLTNQQARTQSVVTTG